MRFLSIEPLLENLGDVDFSSISWVIIGGESGSGFRFMDREWVISLLAQCREQGIPVFFKQWGGTASDAGGCLLDGLEIKEFPIWYESRKSLSSSDLLSV